MDLAKIKICPECGKQNPPNLIECRYCEADLTGVKVLDSEIGTQQIDEKPIPNLESTSPDFVRICECGTENPPQARKCKACGEDISDILPQQIESKNNEPFSYQLLSVDRDFSVTINKTVIIIGREAELKDYLSDKTYVSRQHARLTVVAEKVFIENLSRTNKTFLNNIEIPDATPVAITNGDEIGIGGKVINGNRQDRAAYFILQIVS